MSATNIKSNQLQPAHAHPNRNTQPLGAPLNPHKLTITTAELGPGHTIVTVLCDGGSKYLDKCFSPAWLKAQGLEEAAAVDASRDHADFVG